MYIYIYIYIHTYIHTYRELQGVTKNTKGILQICQVTGVYSGQLMNRNPRCEITNRFESGYTEVTVCQRGSWRDARDCNGLGGLLCVYIYIYMYIYIYIFVVYMSICLYHICIIYNIIFLSLSLSLSLYIYIYIYIYKLAVWLAALFARSPSILPRARFSSSYFTPWLF